MVTCGNLESILHSFNLSFTHSQHAEQLLCSSHLHSLTLLLSHSLTLDMLNNFCFHVYVQKSSDFQLQNKNKNIVYKQIFSTRMNSHVFLETFSENTNKNNVYKQINSRQNKFVYDRLFFKCPLPKTSCP